MPRAITIASVTLTDGFLSQFPAPVPLSVFFYVHEDVLETVLALMAEVRDGSCNIHNLYKLQTVLLLLERLTVIAIPFSPAFAFTQQ